MKIETGSNIRNVKSQNRMLVLEHIAAHNGISRADIARSTGLSKMTVGNLVTELSLARLVEEVGEDTTYTPVSHGRKPIMLKLSSESPCICGMLIKRELCQIVLADLGGNIFFRREHAYKVLTSPETLIRLLEDLFAQCRQSTTRRILAIGISCLGPLNSTDGILLNPPCFYGIENLPIATVIKESTGLPVFLVNDANAGAFAEKIFGSGKALSNFAYLHIMNGIGAGFVLNNELYDGDSGQSGEIGHTSINLNGPRCSCGNRGCLDLYANRESMCARIAELRTFYPGSPLAALTSPSWADIIAAGNAHDALAVSVLEEFCSYIACSLTNVVNLLNLSSIIVGYDSVGDGFIIEKLLYHKLSQLVMSAKYQTLSVTHSALNGDAPLLGSIALVADKVFHQELPLSELLALT